MADAQTSTDTIAVSPETRNKDRGVVVANQWKLMWRKFRKHRLAMIGGIATIGLYLVVLFVEFLAPFPPDAYAANFTYAPPQTLHLFDNTPEGLRFQPYVNGYIVEIDYNAGRRNFVIDPETKYPVGFFVQGEPYRLLGLIEMDIHLIGPINQGDPMYLAGADRLGRDMLSRTIYGTRVSMTVGLIGVTFSLFFGILFGGISGYFGGVTDNFIQRMIEFLQSIPSIPLWIGLAAAIPAAVPPVQVYFMITLILALFSWTGLARVVRGRFIALKTEDFVKAARIDGCSSLRIIFRHMVPSFTSHIIAVVTLAIPGMILAETALSFLGVGLRPPVVSWGVLLQEAQNVRSLSQAPWLFLPGLYVVIAVLALNFLGDGLRDAADPYT
ncbi:MAG: ABC transporter permease [Anaerolineae bacterium]|nr:ABC transporter permease [Anaerolineae bacterium]